MIPRRRQETRLVPADSAIDWDGDADQIAQEIAVIVVI
jgi:hypothetical protein